jgi:hypothetical protein
MGVGNRVFRPCGAVSRSVKEEERIGFNRRFMDEFYDSRDVLGELEKEGSRHVIRGQITRYIVEPGDIDIVDVQQVAR